MGEDRAIETRVGRFELIEPGIIFWTVSFAATLDGDSAGEAAAAAKTLASGEPVVILADAAGWDSRTGRHGTSSPTPTSKAWWRPA